MHPTQLNPYNTSLAAIRFSLAGALYKRYGHVDIQFTVSEKAQFVFKFLEVTFETPKMVETESETFPCNAKPSMVVETMMRLIEARLTEEERRPARAVDQVKAALEDQFPNIDWVVWAKPITGDADGWITICWKKDDEEDRHTSLQFQPGTPISEMALLVSGQVYQQLQPQPPEELKWQNQLQAAVDAHFPNDKFQVIVENSLINYFFVTVKLDRYLEVKVSHHHDDATTDQVEAILSIIERNLENNKK